MLTIILATSTLSTADLKSDVVVEYQVLRFFSHEFFYGLGRVYLKFFRAEFPVVVHFFFGFVLYDQFAKFHRYNYLRGFIHSIENFLVGYMIHPGNPQDSSV